MALVVVDRYPLADASGVYINDVVWAQFSQELDSETVNYYNFTVNERDTYEPVTGTVELQGVSGNLNDAIIVFVPTNGFSRNTRYSVVASTGLKNKAGTEYLDHDTVWYFTTGATAESGVIGDEVYDLDPSGFTASGVVASGAISGAAPLEVLSTYPADYDTNVSRSLEYIKIVFNGVIPSGDIDLYDKIRITRKGVLE